MCIRDSAKDAYLNIVVGNVYDTRFFRNIQNETYSLNKVFQFDVKGAWSKDDSIATVRKYMSKNNILTTRMPLSLIHICVIGADGTLTGYAGGPDRKKKLLLLERGRWM